MWGNIVQGSDYITHNACTSFKMGNWIFNKLIWVQKNVILNIEKKFLGLMEVSTPKTEEKLEAHDA